MAFHPEEQEYFFSFFFFFNAGSIWGGLVFINILAILSYQVHIRCLFSILQTFILSLDY